MDGERKINKKRKKKQTELQIGQYFNRLDVSEKKIR